MFIVCLSETEMGMVQLLILWPQRVACYERHCIVSACHRTSNRQQHFVKIIRGAGPKRGTIFHLHVTACRGRGSHHHDERLTWVAGDFMLQLIRLERATRSEAEEECSSQVERAPPPWGEANTQVRRSARARQIQ